METGHVTCYDTLTLVGPGPSSKDTPKDTLKGKRKINSHFQRSTAVFRVVPDMWLVGIVASSCSYKMKAL